MIVEMVYSLPGFDTVNLWVNTNISEGPTASIFRVELCRVMNRLIYIGKL
jgi:hypothetical protein